MDIQEAQAETGFDKCEFGPERGSPCESCDTDFEQLYFRSTDPFSQDSEYFCANCVIAEAVENEETLSRLAAKQE